MQGAAIYLYDLIDRQGLKVGVVQKRAGVGENYLWRLESGQIKKPSMEKLGALVRVLRGDIKHIEQLLSGEETDPLALAAEAALRWLTDADVARIEAKARADAARLSDTELDTYIAELETVKQDRDGQNGSAVTPQRKRPWSRRRSRL